MQRQHLTTLTDSCRIQTPVIDVTADAVNLMRHARYIAPPVIMVLPMAYTYIMHAQNPVHPRNTVIVIAQREQQEPPRNRKE